MAIFILLISAIAAILVTVAKATLMKAVLFYVTTPLMAVALLITFWQIFAKRGD